MSIADLVAHLGLKVDKKGFDEAREGFNSVRETIRHVIEAVGVLEGIHILKDWTEETIEAASGVKHLAEQLGTTTAAVQSLSYAADVTGSSAEGMRTAMERLSLGFEEASRTGGGPLVEALGKLGLSANQLRGMGLDDQIARIAEGFKTAGPNVNKTGLAMEIFGREGAQMIPLLNKGADGLRDLRSEFAQTGALLDDETIDKFEDLEIQQKKLGYTWRGLKNEAVAALLPALRELVDGILKWVKANRELIKTALEKVIKGVAIALKVLGEVFSVVITIVKEILVNWKAMAIALGVLAAAFIVVKAEAVAAGIKTAMAWLAATAPIALVAAGIAAVILVIQDLYTWAEGGDSVFKDLYDSFEKNLGGTAAGKIVNALIDGIKGIAVAIGGAIKKLGEFFDAVDARDPKKQEQREADRLRKLVKDPKARKKLATDISVNGAFASGERDNGLSILGGVLGLGAFSDTDIGRRATRLAPEAAGVTSYDLNNDMVTGKFFNDLAAQVRAPDFDPWAYRPSPTVPTRESNSFTHSIHNAITIHAATDDAEKLGATVVHHISQWWDGQTHDAHAATTAGSRRP